MKKIEFMNGEECHEPTSIHAASLAALFGWMLFTRIRFRRSQDGKVRIFALDQHLTRLGTSVGELFNPGTDFFKAQQRKWKEWIVQAVQTYVKGGGSTIAGYIHIGVGPYSGMDAMLTDGGTQFGTYISVTSSPPLYGRGLFVVSSTKYTRARGPLAGHKMAGNYPDILALKQWARAEVPIQLGHAVPDGYAAEVLLYDQLRRTMAAELGCANIGAIVGDTIEFAGRQVFTFPGITERAIRWLVNQGHVPGLEIIDTDEGLTRRKMATGGFSMGTAGYHGVVPFIWMDGKDVPPNKYIIPLQTAYAELWDGEIEDSFQWTTVVPGI